MKPSVKQMLEKAKQELSYKESPAGSNNTKYGKWYGLNGQPWCMMYIMWLFHEFDAMDMLPGKTASCGQFRTMAKKAGNWRVSDYKPGDIVIMTFSLLRTPQHCGIVQSVRPDGTLLVYEGNTAVNNQSNGGEVMLRSRKPSVVLGAYRPDYAPEKSAFLAAQECADGKGGWGTGAERKKKLAEAGYDAATVQKMVNGLLRDGIPVTVKVNSYLTVRGEASDKGTALARWQNGRKVKIKEVKAGPGASAWGRAGNAGWISLDYVELD